MGCNNSKAGATQEPAKPAPLAPTLLDKDKVSAKAPADLGVQLGVAFPDFECESTQGKFRFHDFLDREGLPPWTILFSYSRDFDPVSTTELAVCSSLVQRFAKLGAKLIGLSCDSIPRHQDWSKDILASKQQHAGLLGTLLGEVEGVLGFGDHELGFPLIADESREIAGKLGLLHPKLKDTAGMPLLMNALFCISPDKTARNVTLQPAATGRSLLEVLRLLESLVLTHNGPLATPANWKAGERVVVTSNITDAEAQATYSNLEASQLPSGGYMRQVDCPSQPMPGSSASSPISTGLRCLKLGEALPDCLCKTTEGEFSLHQLLERGPAWTVLCTHPECFAPVSTTELSQCETVAAKFERHGAKFLGLCGGPLTEVQAWCQDVLSVNQWGSEHLAFPLIADESGDLTSRLGLPCELQADVGRTSAPAHGLFFISPEKTVLAMVLQPTRAGCCLDETLRLVLALQLTHNTNLATPANWTAGDRLLLAPEVLPQMVDEQRFKNLEVQDLPSQQKYLRYVDCPAEQTGAASDRSGCLSPASAMCRDLLRQSSAASRVTVFEVETRHAVCC